MSTFIPPPELKALADDTVSEIWMDNIYRDFEDEIKYIDGEQRSTPRPQEDIERINGQIDHYASELTDEFIEKLKEIEVYTLPDYYSNLVAHEVHKQLWVKYRRKFRDYVGSEFSD